MVEEQHVSQYGSLLNPALTWLENLLLHQYVECWLYWSCRETETDGRIRGLWDFLFAQELMHLHIARELLRQYEGKEYAAVLPDAEFPAPLRLESNVEYVRGVLGGTAHNTAVREDYADVRQLASLDTFADYQHQVNEPLENVVSRIRLFRSISARADRITAFRDRAQSRGGAARSNPGQCLRGPRAPLRRLRMTNGGRNPMESALPDR